MRLPFPLTLQIFNDKASVPTVVKGKGLQPAVKLPDQYCGVMEFSAPEGNAYLPSWMMANLKLRTGAMGRLSTVTGVRPSHPRPLHARS